MPNIDLTGQVKCEINHAFAITATDVSIRVATPTNVKKGAFGVIGKSKGIKDVTGTLKFAIPKTGLEFDVDGLDNFTLTYHLNPVQRFMVLGCDITDKSLSVNQGTGEASVDINFTGTEEVPA